MTRLKPPQGMAYKSETDDTLVSLEKYRFHNGARQPRCQCLKKRVFTQCPQASRKGQEVCHMHGAGTKKRVEKFQKQRPGAARVTTGMYAKVESKDIYELRDLVEAAEVKLESTDAELANLKAITWYWMQHSPEMMERGEQLRETLEWLAEAPSTYNLRLDEREMKTLVSHINMGYKLVYELKRFLHDLSDSNMRVFQATKMRAEMKSKMAESEALAYFLIFAQKIRNIVHDIVQDEDSLDVFELRIKREILNPVGAVLDDDPKAPPVLGKPIKN